MPYLGLSPVTREGDDFRINNFAAGVDFTAGSSTQVTLTNSPATENAILVSMDGVTQHHNTFSLSGTTLTFSEAIPTGVTNIEVQYYIKSTLNTVATGAINANTMFADGVITNHAINSSVTLGAGYYKGENGTLGNNAGDIFRVNETELNTDVTITSTENASATGPLTVASGVTLTVDGTLRIL